MASGRKMGGDKSKGGFNKTQHLVTSVGISGSSFAFKSAPTPTPSSQLGAPVNEGKSSFLGKRAVKGESSIVFCACCTARFLVRSFAIV